MGKSHEFRRCCRSKTPQRWRFLEQVHAEHLTTALVDKASLIESVKRVSLVAERNTAVQLATLRFDAVRGSWLGGDRPAIDTLEAFLQLQDRRMRQQQADLSFRNAGLRLSDHLWDASQRPLQLEPTVLPDPNDLVSPALGAFTPAAIDSAIAGHPLLAQAGARIDQLEVDRRLRAEYLKPELDLKYHWLGDGGPSGGQPGRRGAQDGDRGPQAGARQRVGRDATGRGKRDGGCGRSNRDGGRLRG